MKEQLWAVQMNDQKNTVELAWLATEVTNQFYIVLKNHLLPGNIVKQGSYN